VPRRGLSRWQSSYGAGFVAAGTVLVFLAVYGVAGEPGISKPTAANPDEPAIRRACLDSLKKIEQEVTKLIAKHPAVLGHLGVSSLDEERLCLHFPVRKTEAQRAEPSVRRGPDPRPPEKEGLFFQYTLQPGQTAHSFAFTRVGFSQHWHWSNRAFPWDIQDELGKAALHAMRLVTEQEDAAIAADFAKRDKQSYVLRGGPGLVLTAHVAEKPGPDGPIVELWETNTSARVVAIHPGYAQRIRDGRTCALLASMPGLFFEPLVSGNKDPFLYLKPGEKLKVGSVVLGTRSPGSYRLRVAWCHDRDGWLDVTPTYHDGSPVWRKVENAWTGVLVSNELTIEITGGAEPIKGR